LSCTVYMQDSDWRPTFNRCSILKSMSEFYVTDICTSELSPFFKFSNLCPFSNSQIGIQFSNLWWFLTLSNRRPMMLLTYALTLTNKSAIDLRIWKGHRFENNLNRSMNWDNKVSGCRSESIIYITDVEQGKCCFFNLCSNVKYDCISSLCTSIYRWISLSRSSRDRCKISSYPKFD
jgi:hypothetical protein